MRFFKSYSDAKPPTRGTGKKIYQALKKSGYVVHDLHYNPNNFGRRAERGWGTWACAISGMGYRKEYLCGWDDEVGAYLQGCAAPFNVVRAFLSLTG